MGLELFDIIKLLISILWVPFVGLMMTKRKEEKDEKDKMLNKISSLETQLAVMNNTDTNKELALLKTKVAIIEKTAVTEVDLRDYISERFRESDALQKKELDRLEDKLDDLTDLMNDILRHLPKRGED